MFLDVFFSSKKIIFFLVSTVPLVSLIWRLAESAVWRILTPSAESASRQTCETDDSAFSVSGMDHFKGG